MADVYISFGGDTAGLEASLATAKAEVQNLQKELNSLGREMQSTGSSAESELGQHMRAVAESLVGARGQARELSGELSNLGKNGQEASGFFTRFTSGVKDGAQAVSSFMDILPGVAEAIGAAFAVEKISQFVEQMTALGTETTRAAEVLGIPIQNVASLGLIAKNAGIDLETLETSFTRLSKNIVDQTSGAQRALSALGLTFHDLQGKDAQEQLGILADAMQKVTDGSEKDAIGVALMGRSFNSLLPLLDQGSSAIKEWEAIAAETGTKLDSGVRDAMEKTEQQIIRLGAAFQGDGIAVFREFAPVIQGVVKFVADLAIEFSEAMKEGGLLKDAVDLVKVALQLTETAIVSATKFLEAIWTIGVTAFDDIAISVDTAGKVIADVFTGAGNGLTAFFSGLLTAAREATKVVGQEFMDLGQIVAAAFSGNLTGAEAAWTKMGTDAQTAGSAIKNAFTSAIGGFDYSKVGDDVAQGEAAVAARTQQGMDTLVKLNQHAVDEIETIWDVGGGKAAAQVEQHMARMAAAGNAAAQAAHNAALVAVEGLNEEIKATEDAATQKQKAINDDLAQKRITSAQWLSESKTLLLQEAADVQAFYDKELALAHLTDAEKARIKAQEADTIRKIDNQILDDERKNADDVAKKWQQVASQIEGALGNALKGIVTGAQTPIQALMNLLNTLASDAIDAAAKMAEQWVLAQVTHKAAATADVTTAAGVSFANVVSFLSAVMGPAAVGPAAATQAEVLSVGLAGIYDTGSMSVPHDMVAAVHQGEVIIPQRGGLADEFRDMVAGGGLGGKGGGDQHIHIHATDAQSFMNLLKTNGRELAKLVAQTFNDNQSLRPSY